MQFHYERKLAEKSFLIFALYITNNNRKTPLCISSLVDVIVVTGLLCKSHIVSFVKWSLIVRVNPLRNLSAN